MRIYPLLLDDRIVSTQKKFCCCIVEGCKALNWKVLQFTLQMAEVRKTTTATKTKTSCVCSESQTLALHMSVKDSSKSCRIKSIECSSLYTNMPAAPKGEQMPEPDLLVLASFQHLFLSLHPKHNHEETEFKNSKTSAVT
jgi:hypothetical protein